MTLKTVLSYTFSHQDHIYIHMGYILQLSSGSCLLFYWAHIFYQWFFNSIIASITPIQANDKWIVTKFIRIQISNRWFDHALLIIQRYTFYCQWFIKTLISAPELKNLMTHYTIATILFQYSSWFNKTSYFFIKYLWIFTVLITSKVL